MHILVLAAVVLSGEAWAAAKISKCEAYLLAPEEIKEATFSVLSRRGSLRTRKAAQKAIADYVKSAPNGLASLADYLKKLEENSPEKRTLYIGDFAEQLYVSYLSRPENAKFAIERIDNLADIFWLQLMYGTVDFDTRAKDSPRDRFREGYAMTEELLKIFERAAKTRPEIARTTWSAAFERYSPEILQLLEIIRKMRRTVATLESRVVDPAESAEELERRQYMTMLVNELDHPLENPTADEMMQFYRWREELFRGHTFEEDMEKARGDGMESISPLRTFVFLVRMNRRLPPELKSERFREVELVIDKIRKLLAKASNN
jgi:hypothetical protein